MRFNAPLEPALALGADAVVIVGTHPAEPPTREAPNTENGQPPDVDDALVQLMDAALVDRMVEDVRTLAKINELVRGGGQRSSEQRPLRVVPWLFFGPKRRGTLGGLAADCYDRQYGHWTDVWPRLRHPDLALLGRLLAGDGPRRGDLLSYVFFEPEFLEAAIAQGQRDAEKLFAEAPHHAVPWRDGLPSASR